ncbi:hypothetical protein PG984_006821 [Apiospora sp. TS-2023a]
MPSLTELPPEVIDLICQWSDGADLLALRLVGKKLSRNVGIDPAKQHQGTYGFQDGESTRAFVFMALLKVLAVTKSVGINDHEYCIDTLDVCCLHESYGVSVGSEYLPIFAPDCDWSGWGPAFQHLRCRHLHLALRSFSTRIEGSLPDSDTPFMNALAETTPHLKTLALGYKNWTPAGFVSLSKSVRFTCLQSLVLGDVYTRSDTLIQFLRTATPTLRQLRLQRINLVTLARDLSVRRMNIPPEETKEAWYRLWHFIKTSMEDLQYIFIHIPILRGRLRLRNPLRGQVGHDPYVPDRPSHCYDKAVANIGLAEWIDQLGFEEDEDCLSDRDGFLSETDSHLEWDVLE